MKSEPVNDIIKKIVCKDMGVFMEDKMFFHYFSAAEDKCGNNYSLKSLKTGKVSFAHINCFNDPCEIAILPDEISFDTTNSDMKYLYELYIRVFCFSETFQNPLMWGHYGNSHKGFCVGYDLNDILNIPEYKDTLRFGKVSYSDNIPLLSDEDIEKGAALYYKSSDWEQENESRATIRLPHNSDNHISEIEFKRAREEWLESNPFFEKAVDSHLRLPFPLSSDVKEIRNRIQTIRQDIKGFENKDYAYCAFTEKTTGKTVYGKFPMRVECSLKAKVIYIGLNTSDEVRTELKNYAKVNGIEIYEMGIERGKYSFIPQKVVLL